jgi:hypothetical protein
MYTKCGRSFSDLQGSIRDRFRQLYPEYRPGVGFARIIDQLHQFQRLDDDIAGSLRQMSKIRNQVAHEQTELLILFDFYTDNPNPQAWFAFRASGTTERTVLTATPERQESSGPRTLRHLHLVLCGTHDSSWPQPEATSRSVLLAARRCRDCLSEWSWPAPRSYMPRAERPTDRRGHRPEGDGRMQDDPSMPMH